MRIVGAEVLATRLALRRPLATSRGAIAEREGHVLRLVAEDGATGEGEAAPAYWIGEGSLADAAEDLRRIAARVTARPDASVLRSWLEHEDGPALGAAAGCALDAALLDLEARRRGLPVAVLLGGERSPRAVAALVGGRDAAELGAVAAAAVADGFGTLKLKVGDGPLADDVARLAIVRRHAPPPIALRLDANGAWTRGDARRALAAFAPFGVAFVEEPLRDADPRALADLARTAPVALAADESIATAADLERLLAAGARVHLVLKAGRVGGPSRLVALARRAAAAGLPVVVTDGIEGPIGTGVAVHAAAAIGAPLAIGLGGMQLARAMQRRPWVTAGGPGFAIAGDGSCTEVSRG